MNTHRAPRTPKPLLERKSGLLSSRNMLDHRSKKAADIASAAFSFEPLFRFVPGFFLVDNNFTAVKYNRVFRISSEVELSLEFLTTNPGHIDIPTGRDMDHHASIHRVFVDHTDAIPCCTL